MHYKHLNNKYINLAYKLLQMFLTWGTYFSSLFISQEYVEPPVSIRLKPQVQYEPATRATSRAVLSSTLDMVQVDSIYAVTSDNEEGFVLTVCKTVLQSEFEEFSLNKIVR